MMKIRLLIFLLLCCSVQADVGFTVDTADQRDGNAVFNHVANTWARGGWIDNPSPPGNWIESRFEGVITHVADWWGMSDPFSNYTVVNGNYEFVPAGWSRAVLDMWAVTAGAKPMIVMGTASIPAPLIEGGYHAGHYGFNVRQPNDYAKWQYHVKSTLQWLIDQYGLTQVRTWRFVFGIEGDWQVQAVYPGTTTEMNEADNRQEFLKMLDYFHAACVEKLGPSVYVGCYFAFESQADDCARHWAQETNYATGQTGTRIGFLGFSDWVSVTAFPRSPFDLTGLYHRQAHNWAHEIGAAASGMKWKYDYLEGLLQQYPQLDYMDIHIPEQGYYDVQGGTNPSGSTVPADTHFADHRGAALYAMRTIAYAQCPRLTSTWTRYALGTGDLNRYYADDVKAAVFHALRIEKKFAGERQLPVATQGDPTDPGNDVRMIASTTDDGTNTIRLLIVNFNEDIDAATAEDFEVFLTGLPTVPSVTVKEYRIDRFHNNWWYDWKAYREGLGIPYVGGNNSGHLGANIDYDDEYAPFVNDPIGTMPEDDIPTWLAKLVEYRAVDDLAETASYQVPVLARQASLAINLRANSVLYLEISHDADMPGVEDDFELGYYAWTPSGSVGISTQAHGGSLAVKLTPSAGAAARIERVFEGLMPNRNYVLTAWGRSSGGLIDYRIGLMSPGESSGVECRGLHSNEWNRMVVTAKSDTDGRIKAQLLAPAQPMGANDQVVFDDVALTLAESISPADINRDGVVDSADVVAFADSWLDSNPFNPGQTLADIKADFDLANAWQYDQGGSDVPGTRWYFSDASSGATGGYLGTWLVTCGANLGTRDAMYHHLTGSSWDMLTAYPDFNTGPLIREGETPDYVNVTIYDSGLARTGDRSVDVRWTSVVDAHVRIEWEVVALDAYTDASCQGSLYVDGGQVDTGIATYGVAPWQGDHETDIDVGQTVEMRLEKAGTIPMNNMLLKLNISYSSTPSYLPADLNYDQVVNLHDFTILANAWVGN